MTKVLTLRFGEDRHEIHLLNIGDRFEGFGGSRHPLIAGHNFATGEKLKRPTASLVIRRHSAMGQEDKEMDIDDPVFWAWMARMLNGAGPDEALVDGKTAEAARQAEARRAAKA